MKLPNGDRAEIDERKLTRYLLSQRHVAGAAKARFFASVGYDSNNWRRLHDDLLRIAAEEEAEEVATPYAMKYIVHGMLDTPSRRSVALTTV